MTWHTPVEMVRSTEDPVADVEPAFGFDAETRPVVTVLEQLCVVVPTVKPAEASDAPAFTGDRPIRFGTVGVLITGKLTVMDVFDHTDLPAAGTVETTEP